VTPPAVPEHRAAEEVVEVRANGRLLANADVTVEQTRHAFGFGNIGFEVLDHLNGGGEPGDAGLAELWLGVFDLAILPFYWADFEPEEGRPRTDRLRRAAEWFAAHDVRVKGHPLVWHTLAPDRLIGRTPADVADAVRARIRREVGDFRGLIGSWDVVNEAVIAPVFDNGDNAITPLVRELGRVEYIRLAVDEARETDPAVVLHLNDFDLSPAYEALIEEVLAGGIRLDGIGLQTHMHQGYRGEEEVLAITDRFARFGLPLHFTETTLVSGDLMPPEIVDLNDYVRDDWPSTREGEARQAAELERHYRALFGHPAVASITYWGLADRGAWLGAPAGLVRLDGTPKPGYETLRRLIREEWWTPATTLRTDENGRMALAGTRGTYRLSAAGLETRVDLDGGAGLVAELR
jgi:endo-1,4-beta-xylanase